MNEEYIFARPGGPTVPTTCDERRIVECGSRRHRYVEFFRDGKCVAVFAERLLISAESAEVRQ